MGLESQLAVPEVSSIRVCSGVGMPHGLSSNRGHMRRVAPSTGAILISIEVVTDILLDTLEEARNC